MVTFPFSWHSFLHVNTQTLICSGDQIWFLQYLGEDESDNQRCLSVCRYCSLGSLCSSTAFSKTEQLPGKQQYEIYGYRDLPTVLTHPRMIQDLKKVQLAYS